MKEIDEEAITRACTEIKAIVRDTMSKVCEDTGAPLVSFEAVTAALPCVLCSAEGLAAIVGKCKKDCSNNACCGNPSNRVNTDGFRFALLLTVTGLQDILDYEDKIGYATEVSAQRVGEAWAAFTAIYPGVKPETFLDPRFCALIEKYRQDTGAATTMANTMLAKVQNGLRK